MDTRAQRSARSGARGAHSVRRTPPVRGTHTTDSRGTGRGMLNQGHKKGRARRSTQVLAFGSRGSACSRLEEGAPAQQTDADCSPPEADEDEGAGGRDETGGSLSRPSFVRRVPVAGDSLARACSAPPPRSRSTLDVSTGDGASTSSRMAALKAMLRRLSDQAADDTRPEGERVTAARSLVRLH